MIPSFEKTSRLVARGLGITTSELSAGWRTAAAADLPAIVALREAIRGRQERWDDAQYLRWRYGLDSKRRAYARYRILVHNGEVIAGIGAEEFQLRSSAGIVNAACPMDILSLPQYRHIGLGPWLNQALFQQYPLVIALGANHNSAGLVSRLYSLLPGRNEFHLPMNVAKFLQKRISLPFLHTLISPLATAALRTRAAWLKWRSRAHRAHIKPLDRFDSIADKALMNDSAAGISIVRSADYLNWRYCDNPRTNYRILAMQNSAAMTGYLVYRRSDSLSPTRHVQVADWWVADTAPHDALGALTEALLAETQDFEPSFIAATALGKRHHEQLRQSGFFRRDGEHNATGYHCAQPDLHAAIRSTQLWQLTDLGDDGDGLVV